jgi:hypothetical protein
MVNSQHKDIQHNSKKRNAQHNGRVIMLSVKYKPLMLNVIMLKAVMLSVVKRIVVAPHVGLTR